MFPLWAMVMGDLATGIAPTLSMVAASGAAVGDIAGGYAATLTGTGLTGATGVMFGGTAATSVVVVNATTITCVVPTHAAGAVSVIVTTPGGSNAANTLFEFYSPAQEVLSGWWRAPFSGSPLAGVASSGASSGRNLTEATNPPSVGAALNGKNVVAFDGVNDKLGNAVTIDTYLSNTAGSIFSLFYLDTAASDVGAAAFYTYPALLTDSANGFFSLALTTAGLTLGTYNGTNFDGVRVAVGTGAWHLAQARWNSTTLEVRIDGGSWTTLARTLSLSSDGIRLGANYAAGAFLAGKIADQGVLASRLSDTAFDKLRAYVSTRYGLTL